MKQWVFGLLFSLSVGALNAADLTVEQVEQQIQLSHMLGQISVEEQNLRIQLLRTYGVDKYYEWLKNDTRPVSKSASNNK